MRDRDRAIVCPWGHLYMLIFRELDVLKVYGGLP